MGLSFAASLMFAACTGSDGKRGTADTPTSGHVKVGSDDCYQLIMDAEKMMFESLYVKAEVDVISAPENEILKLLMADSIRFAILSRKLSPEEENIIRAKKVEPTYIKIAYDGLALIVHPENPVKNLTMPQLRQIFSGEISSWKQLDKESKQDSIRIVFDNAGSSNARYIRDSLLPRGASFPKNCFAVNSNPAVVDYVSEHRNAMGIIGGNWVSDSDDSLSKVILSRIHVLGLSRLEGGEFFTPHPAYIAQGNYPLYREVYIIKREVGTGLGTGFAAFIAGEKGQRIILKGGLVPATMPLRIVDIKTE